VYSLSTVSINHAGTLSVLATHCPRTVGSVSINLPTVVQLLQLRNSSCRGHVAPSKQGFVVHWEHSQRLGQPLRGTKGGKSFESVQCAMLKACEACADMGQL